MLRSATLGVVAQAQRSAVRTSSACAAVAADARVGWAMDARRELAALYHVVADLGWTHSIFNHITAKIAHPSDARADAFLLQPFGLEYPEVTPCSLVLVDGDGDVLVPSPTPYSFSRAAFGLHSVIHKARPDARVVMHIHTVPGSAASALPPSVSLLPLCQEALIVGATVGNVVRHPYGGIVLDGPSEQAVRERRALRTSLGPSAKAMILDGHGLVTLGASVGEALHFMFNLVHALEVQATMLATVGGDVERLADQCAAMDAHAAGVFALANGGGGGVVSADGPPPPNGKLEWDARIRSLARRTSVHEHCCAHACACGATSGAI